jgi:hypothetical protein
MEDTQSWVDAALGVCSTWCMLVLSLSLDSAYACSWCMLVLSVSLDSAIAYGRCMLVLGVCIYSANACTRRQLMIMAWRETDG